MFAYALWSGDKRARNPTMGLTAPRRRCPESSGFVAVYQPVSDLEANGIGARGGRKTVSVSELKLVTEV